MHEGTSDLLSVLMEETGGLGVDIVVDAGGNFFFSNHLIFIILRSVKSSEHLHACFLYEVRLQEEESSEEMKLLPHKHDIISVLGVGGHWVTSHKNLQVTHLHCT